MKQTLLINGFAVEAQYDEQTVQEIFQPLIRHLAALQAQNGKRVIAFIAAPPAAGKSTLAAFLQQLAREMDGVPPVQAVGMDGFHYPQSYIACHTAMRDGKRIPMQQIKGAPESFDVQKLTCALEKMRIGDVLWPAYDRRLHDVVENAICVNAPIVLVEGNYLLLDAPVWRNLQCDYSLFIEASEAQLRDRLLQRKMRGGATLEQALVHYENCDGPNVRLCLAARRACDLTLTMIGDGAYCLKV